ncbi:hypothetical protein [Rheinheimera sp.]|uniref:hypothetical protein n=1 Tax=Rheinheimera sp. TaxID=1869214 RepID=UPI0040479216
MSKDVSDMLGFAFEVTKFEQSGKTQFVARSLDEHSEIGFVTIVIIDGVVTKRYDNCSQRITSLNVSTPSVEYYHASLEVDVKTGLVEFDALPYRANPYPEKDQLFSDVYVHVDENKVWAITEDTSGNLITVYKNDVTKQRYIYQEISNNQTLSQRAQSKLQKGYIKVNPGTFSSVDRKLN